jgi:hypothetical protein
MRSALLIAVMAAGCSSQPARLRVDKVGIAEDAVPLVLALRVTNEGGTTAVVESADVTFLKKAVIAPQEALSGVPQTLDCVPVFKNGDRVEIAPGATEELYFALVWQLGDNPPPALALVKASVTINPNQATSPPMSFILQSYPGQLDAAVSREPAPEQDKPLLELMEEFDGKRSDGFMRLLHSLEAKRKTI